jgi:hypothetical protein
VFPERGPSRKVDRWVYWSKMRSTTAAVSAGPARKYRALVSREAWPRRAWTWAGSAPPWRRRAFAGYFAELGEGRADLGLGRLTPVSVPLGDAVQARNEQPVTVRSGTIMSHLARIEYAYDKSKLAHPVLWVDDPGGARE